MTPSDILHFAILPALELLPGKMHSRGAIAMLLAIGLQESRFEHRRQIQGPARGYWQFERAGVRGVVVHSATTLWADEVATRLGYPDGIDTIHAAIEHNDLLAAVFARLNLWWLTAPLPRHDDPDEGWRQYIEAWRPGKPHRSTWDAFYTRAWEMVV